jgi:hypothetical protein
VPSRPQGQADARRLLIPLSTVTRTVLTENPARPPSASRLEPSPRGTTAPTAAIADEERAQELNRSFGRPAFPVKVPDPPSGTRNADSVLLLPVRLRLTA